MNGFTLGVWLIVGMMVLSRGEIGRWEYGLCWLCLIVELIADLVRGYC